MGDLNEYSARERELIEALRLTVEYVGHETFPFQQGYSWYDAMKKHAPDTLKNMRLGIYQDMKD